MPPFAISTLQDNGKWKPDRLTLWQRIKKHGLKARIF